MLKICNQPESLWIPKGWGGEKILDNRPEYCCKILNIVRNKRLSIHFHEKKMETFYCLSGKVKIKYHDSYLELIKARDEYGYDEDHVRDCMETCILGPDESIYIPQYRVHQIIALVDSKLIEVSTQHFDKDSIRIFKGD